MVAPFTGAWIETKMYLFQNQIALVAPFTGAWIETIGPLYAYDNEDVAPFTGAWIETRNPGVELAHQICRTLHGCVD